MQAAKQQVRFSGNLLLGFTTGCKIEGNLPGIKHSIRHSTVSIESFTEMKYVICIKANLLN